MGVTDVLRSVFAMEGSVIATQIISLFPVACTQHVVLGTHTLVKTSNMYISYQAIQILVGHCIFVQERYGSCLACDF